MKIHYLNPSPHTHLQAKTWLLKVLINNFISMSLPLLLLKGGLKSTISFSCLHCEMVSCQNLIYTDVYLFIASPFCMTANLPAVKLLQNSPPKKKILGVALKMLITKTVGVPEGSQTSCEYRPFGCSIVYKTNKKFTYC